LAGATSKIIFRAKHISVKYHFFRQHLSDEIQVKKVDTTSQLLQDMHIHQGIGSLSVSKIGISTYGLS